MSIASAAPTRAAIEFILVIATLDIMTMGIVAPVLPHLIEAMIGSNAQAGVINGGFIALWAAMQFICGPIIGALSDAYGRRPVLLVSAAGLAADYVLMAVAPNLWWLALGRILSGVTTASFTAVFAYMADVTAPADRARGFGLVGAAFSVGLVTGPLLGGLLGEISPRAPFWAAAAVSGATFLYGLFILPESLKAENRRAFSWSRANPFGALKLLRSHAELSGLACVNFLLHFAHHVFSAVFVLYGALRYGWTAGDIGVLLAFVCVLDIVVQGALLTPAVKRFGERLTIAIGIVGGAIGLAAMGASPNGWLFAAAMVPNALWGLATPTIRAIMTRRVSANEQGELQGANSAILAFASMFGPVLFGWLYARSVPDAPGLSFYVAAALLAAGAALAWRTTGSPAEGPQHEAIRN